MDLLTFLTRLSILLSYSTFVLILDFNLPVNNLCNILSLPFFYLLSSKDHFLPYFRAPFTWITKVTALPPASQLQTPCSLASISSRPPPQLSYYNSPNRPLLSTHCEPYHFSSYPSSTLISFLSSVQSLSCVQLFLTPWTAACQASLSLTISWNLPKFMSIELVMPSKHFILCCSLLLLSSIFPSITVFSNEPAVHIRWPKYWSFCFNISPSK